MSFIANSSARPLAAFQEMLIGLYAGLAGGIAEVAWVVFYAGLGDGSAIVARGVTATVVPGLAAGAYAVPLGIAIHMALAAALGIAIALTVPPLLPRSWGAVPRMLAVVASLAVVWSINFGVVLPLVNPSFVDLLPLAASLASKLLFGIAAALVIGTAHGAERMS